MPEGRVYDTYTKTKIHSNRRNRVSGSVFGGNCESMKKLDEKQFNDRKDCPKLQSIGEEMKAHPGLSAKHLKLIDQCDSYPEYLASFDFQAINGQVYNLTNYSNADVMKAITDSTKQILKALAEQNEKR